jgi:hypothetical protein
MKLTTAILAGLLYGCGAGTEIGNGFKPERGSDEPDSQGAKATQDADTDDQGAGENGGTPNAEVDKVRSVDAGYTFAFDLVAAHCGTPFGHLAQSTLRLATKNADGTEANVINASFEAATARWTLANRDGEIVRYVYPSPTSTTDEATPTLANGDAPSVTYVCYGRTALDDVTVDGLAGTYRKVEHHLKLGAAETVITWYLDVGATTKLVRITLDDVDGETDPVVLDVTEPEEP